MYYDPDGNYRYQNGLLKWVADCIYCKSHSPGAFFPNHQASSFCLNGKPEHCTCDFCF